MVGVAAPSALGKCATGLELGAQIRMIVDFAVEGQHEPPIGRKHRLVPRRRQVDDGQPAMAEADARLRVHPQADIVGTTVRHGIGHAFEQAGLDPVGADNSGDPAHSLSLAEVTPNWRGRAPLAVIVARCARGGVRDKPP